MWRMPSTKAEIFIRRGSDLSCFGGHGLALMCESRKAMNDKMNFAVEVKEVLLHSNAPLVWGKCDQNQKHVCALRQQKMVQKIPCCWKCPFGNTRASKSQCHHRFGDHIQSSFNCGVHSNCLSRPGVTPSFCNASSSKRRQSWNLLAELFGS